MAPEIETTAGTVETGSTANDLVITAVDSRSFDAAWEKALSNRSHYVAEAVARALPKYSSLIPHIDQYFGVYAMEEGRFFGIFENANTPDLVKAHIEGIKARGPQVRPKIGEYRVEAGIAVVELVGSMTKYGSSFSDLPYGTIGIRRAVKNAVNDKTVKGIMLLIDSPGGAVAGTSDLANDIKEASKKKPVTAYIEDLGASAAYWVASQADVVVANPGALVGSIGTYMVVNDFSGYYADKRIKTHVIKAGKYKGDGVPGSEITQEQIEDFQRIVNEINELFMKGVAKGRDMTAEKIEELADGRVHEATKAKKLGLVDTVQSYDVAMRQLMARCHDKRRGEGAEAEPISKESIMTDDVKTGSTAPQPVSLEELELFCPGADNEFILGQLRKKATEDQARSEWIDEQNKRLADASKKLKESEEKKELFGAEPVKEPEAKKTNFGGDARAEWFDAIREKERQGLSRPRAVRAVANERPELREALIEQANESRI
jgi:protease-4